jgi:two-component system, LytTR family, response regulator
MNTFPKFWIDRFKFSFEDIIRLEAEGNYTRLVLRDGRSFILSRTLSDYNESFPTQFVRVHRSHIINLNFVGCIKKYSGHEIILTNGTTIPISRRHWILVKGLFGGKVQSSI